MHFTISNRSQVWFTWGIKCNQYRTEISAMMKRDPIPNFVVKWKKLPMYIRVYDRK